MARDLNKYPPLHSVVHDGSDVLLCFSVQLSCVILASNVLFYTAVFAYPLIICLRKSFNLHQPILPFLPAFKITQHNGADFFKNMDVD